MRQLLHRIHILAWPIWLKLLVGFLLAVAVPLILLMVLTLNTVQQVGTQNAESFASETGTRQARAISAAFDEANSEMNRFAANEANFTQLRAVLPTSAGTPVNPNDEFNLAVLLQNQLLLNGNPIYEEVNLVDANGLLVIKAEPDGITVRGANLAGSPGYQQGVQAHLRGETQTLSISVNRSTNQPVLDIVNILSVTVPGVRDKVVIGYLIARLNPAPLIFDYLPVSSDFLNTTSRLVTRQGYVIEEGGVHLLNTPDVNLTLFDQARAGLPQTEIITRDGVQLVRFYAQVENSPFVLVSESAASAVSNQISRFIIERGFALILGLVFLVGVLVILANQLLATPLRRISQVIQAISRGNYSLPLSDVRRGDEIGELAGSVADMRKRVLDVITDLEQRIETRARDMTATREISHTAASQRDLQSLMNQVVNLIIERFPNIYHAQIFLLDSENRDAVLRASTGEAGQHLLARGHRLAVGSVSVIGRCTETGEMVVARDTPTSTVHRRNELLPDTRAELAIPLRLGSTVIGALDVQSKLSDAFGEEQMEVLQTMADQVTVAIENARLHAESVRRLEELERSRRVSTLQAWHEYMNSLRAPHLESAAGVLPVKGYRDDLRQTALERGEVVVGNVTERQTIPMAVPISLRGQLLGTVEWEVPQTEFDQNKVQLAQDLTDRLAVNLENARLFQESQRATQRERLVNEISARLTTQNDIDHILQTAVREVGMALRAPHVSIRLNPQIQTNGSGPHQNGHSNGQGE
jgi:GAF domain-containing protein/HAMP domain-containing protein